MRSSIFFILLTFSFLGFAEDAEPLEDVDCAKAKSNVRSVCRMIPKECTSIQRCLMRKDSCTPGVPESKNACDQLSECNASISAHFPSSERCQYKWVNGTNGHSDCAVVRSFRYEESSCPGIDKFNLLTLGVGRVLDLDFNCEGMKNSYDRWLVSCNSTRTTFSQCQDDPEYEKVMEETAHPECEFANKFFDYKKGEFDVKGKPVESEE